MMLPRPQPQFYGQPQQGGPLAQAQPQQVVDTAQAPGAPNPLLEALRARAMADSQKGASASMQARDPWSAAAQGISGGLEGWANARALDAENKSQDQSRSALLEALSSPDPMQALSLSKDPRAQDAYVQQRIAQLGQKPAEKWKDEDVNSDGVPDYSVNSVTGERKAVSGPDLTFEQRQKIAKAGAANTTINMGGEREFEKETGKIQATMFGDMLKDGYEASADVATIDELGANLAKTPGGVAGGIQSFALSFGVPLGSNPTEAQAAKAIISRLIPRQRPPGSGSSSNLDVNMFADALPKLINTPDGNALILETMKGLAQRRIDAGKIASSAMNGEITRQHATEALTNLPDPLKAFRAKMNGIKLPTTSRKQGTFNPQTGQVDYH